jgi:uncharacterized protein (UPF0261 family)
MRVQARTSVEEMRTVAKAVADKLNQYPNKNRVKFIIPRKGFSSLSTEGGALYDPEADQTFVKELKKALDPGIDIIEVDTHINTPDFARAVVKTLKESLEK